MTRLVAAALVLLASHAVAIPQPQIEERLGAPVPLDVRFTDEEGRSLPLSEVVRGDVPVALVLSWYECPMLCSLVLRGLIDSVRSAGLVPGRDLRLLAVSFAPDDTPTAARRKQESALAALGTDDRRAWPFLVGDQEAIDVLTAATGFGVVHDEATRQYAHDAAFIVLTPEGRISRYLYGVSYAPRDLRLALAEASAGRTGSTTDRVLLTCFRYDPATRRYGFAMFAFLRTGAAIVAIALAAGIVFLRRRERERHAP